MTVWTARFRLIIAALVVALLGPLVATAAHGASNGATALYNGRTLNLAEGWGSAQSCVVFSPARVECFDSNAAADAAVGGGGPTVAGAIDCAFGWLCLYDGLRGTGRRLIFNDNRWQNLRNFDFHDRVESYRNNQIPFDIAGLDRNRDHSKHRRIEPGEQAMDVGPGWRNRAEYVTG
jgi:hypothetical protein